MSSKKGKASIIARRFGFDPFRLLLLRLRPHLHGSKFVSIHYPSDCGIDATCALCSKCFLASDHNGHDVIYSIHSTGCGCCDCGDLEAWKTEVKCRYHHPPTPQASSDMLENIDVDQSSGHTDSAQKAHLNPLPRECKDVIEQIVSIALDYLLVTLDRCPEEMLPPTSLESIYSELSRLEESAYLEMNRRPAPSPDDPMDVDMHYAQHHHHPPDMPFPESTQYSTPANRFATLWGLKGHNKGKGKSLDASTSSNPSVAPSAMSSTLGLLGHLGRIEDPRASHEPLEGERRNQWPGSSDIPADSKPNGTGPWGVVLWNDEKHSYAEVIDQVTRATGCSRTEALQIANTVDNRVSDTLASHLFGELFLDPDQTASFGVCPT